MYKMSTLWTIGCLGAMLGCTGLDPVAPTGPDPDPTPAPVPVVPAAPRVTSFAVAVPRDTLRLGDTVRVEVRATWSDSATRALPVTFTAHGGGTMTGPLFRAGTSVGTFVLVATCACGGPQSAAAAVQDSVAVTIQADPAAVLEVPLRLHRMDGGSGDVLVSNGIPLPAGWLPNPQAPAPVRVRIGGVEVPIYNEVLKGKHKDGSVMSLLVQFNWPASAVGDAVLEVGVPSVLPARAKVAINGAMPAAAALPIDPEYLMSTGIMGPTVSRFKAPQSPAYFKTYEQKFDQWSDTHYSANGDGWGINYYDRVLNHFAFWARTGEPKYWERAARIAISYRNGYLEANAFGAAEWWTMLDGLAYHYWFTGDDRSREAVYKTAENLHGSRGGPDRLPNNTTHPWNDGRAQAKVFGGKVLSYQLEAPPFGAIQDWKAGAIQDFEWIRMTQSPNGGFFFQNNCGVSSNFMSGMVMSAMVQFYQNVSPDPRVLDSVTRWLDWLWSTQWYAPDKIYNYYSGECLPNGDTTPANDLNGFYMEAYGWAYKQTGDMKYIERGDQTFEGLVNKTWFNNSKMYNQGFYYSWRYLGYRP